MNSHLYEINLGLILLINLNRRCVSGQIYGRKVDWSLTDNLLIDD